MTNEKIQRAFNFYDRLPINKKQLIGHFTYEQMGRIYNKKLIKLVMAMK